jgi:hypothetical protein
LPCFSDKSIPLGLASINTVLRAEGHKTSLNDFDYLLNLTDPEAYYRFSSLTFRYESQYKHINVPGIAFTIRSGHRSGIL